MTFHQAPQGFLEQVPVKVSLEAESQPWTRLILLLKEAEDPSLLR